MKSKTPLISGAASEVVTPFAADGAVDHKLLRDEIEFMLDAGVTGMFVNGLASELLMMTEKESFEVAATVIDVCQGKAPVIGNIYANSTVNACNMAKQYKELGADALMIYTPYVYPYTDRGMFGYFNQVANATDLPIYICNVSDSRNKFSPKLLADIFNKNQAFKGYKDGTQNVIDQQTLLDHIPQDREFDLISGSDGLLVNTMQNGGVGIISLITVVFPKLIVDTVAACEAGDWDKARELQGKVLRVREAVKTGPFMAAYKYAARASGHSLGYMRHPLVEVSDAEAEVIDHQLRELGMY